jgi:single-strand DNA-binding protein
VCWSKLAETADEHLKKGQRVYVEGRLQAHKYTGNDGQERTVVEIVANDLVMLSAREEKTEPDGAAAKNAKAKPGPASFGEIDELAEFDDLPF